MSESFLPPPHINFDYYNNAEEDEAFLNALALQRNIDDDGDHQPISTKPKGSTLNKGITAKKREEELNEEDEEVANTEVNSSDSGGSKNAPHKSPIPAFDPITLYTENEQLKTENNALAQRLALLENQNSQIQDIVSHLRQEMETLHASPPTQTQIQTQTHTQPPSNLMDNLPSQSFTRETGEEAIFLRKQVQGLTSSLAKMRIDLLNAINESHESQTRLSACESALAAARFRQHQTVTTLVATQKQMSLISGQCELYYRELITSKDQNKALSRQLSLLKNEVAKCGCVKHMMGENVLDDVVGDGDDEFEDRNSEDSDSESPVVSSEKSRERERALEKEITTLREKLENAVQDIQRLLREKEKLIDISNMLRSDLNNMIAQQQHPTQNTTSPRIHITKTVDMKSVNEETSHPSSSSSSSNDPTLIKEYRDKIAELEDSLRKTELQNKVLKKELQEFVQMENDMMLDHVPQRIASSRKTDIWEKEPEPKQELIAKLPSLPNPRNESGNKPILAVGVPIAVVRKPSSNHPKAAPGLSLKAAAERAEAKKLRLMEQRSEYLSKVTATKKEFSESASASVFPSEVKS